MKSKYKRGISLIVLVITIIVMIILATAIILSLSNSGIINSAAQARNDTDYANANDLKAISDANWLLMTEEQKEVATRKDGEPKGDKKYKTYLELELIKAGYRVGKETGALEVSETGKLYRYPVIPEKFTASIYNGEDTVENGLVIYETEDDLTPDIDNSTEKRDEARKKYNQYVWIPVEKGWEDGVEWEEGLGLLEMKGGTTPPKEEVARINKNGGFYIARYEAGKPKDNPVINGDDKPLSVKGVKVWNNIPWGEASAEKPYGDPTKPGAALVASSVYTDINGLKDKVETRLLYGAEWDAALTFIESAGYDVTDSRAWGNYSDSTEAAAENSGSIKMDHTTGRSEYWKAKNIYDLAGNVWEWTYETYLARNPGRPIQCRIMRGGYYGDNASYYPSASRGKREPRNSSDNCGFRIRSLYKVELVLIFAGQVDLLKC